MQNAPSLVKACYNSIKRNCINHQIIVITENNLLQYIHIPSYILKKYKQNYISRTHFSDLIRLELILKYGGTWLDSTILITKYDKVIFQNNLFFFQSVNKIWSVGSNWLISGERESPILRTTLDMLYRYWSKNNRICHYFLFHLLFKISCDKYLNDYKKIPLYLSNSAHFLQKELFNPFNKTKYDQILNLSTLHKLSRKHTTNITKGLFYHHILEEYY